METSGSQKRPSLVSTAGGKISPANYKNGVHSRFLYIWDEGRCMQQNHFFVPCSTFWSLLDQFIIKIEYRLDFKSLWYSTPFWSLKMYGNVFFPKRFGFAVNVGCCPASALDFALRNCHSKFPQLYDFQSHFFWFEQENLCATYMLFTSHD